MSNQPEFKKSSMNTPLQSTPHEFWQNGVADRLQREKAHILAIWEKRVRMELASARKPREPALLNSLPEFLQHLVNALEEATITTGAERNISESGKEHGANRAEFPYSLEQVLLEYRILREVVFAVLESEKILKPEKRDILLDSFQLAERKAVSEFFRIKIFREQLELLKSESYARSLKDLQEVTETAIAKSTDLQTLIRALLERIKAIFKCDTVAIYLLSDDKKELISCATYGLENDVIEGLRFPVDQGVPGAILKHESGAMIIEDLKRSGIKIISPNLRASGVQMILGISLRADSNLIGAMHIGRIQQQNFRQTEIELFKLVAERIAIAIYNSRLYEKSKEELTRFRLDSALQSQLLSLLAHEIRNPLASAQMSAQLLARKRDRPEVVQELSGRVVKNIQRADNLIKDLLDVNRTLSGRNIQLTIEPSDLNSIILAAIGTLQIRDGDHFVYTPPEKPIQGNWSPSELQRAFEQILKTCLQWNSRLAPIVITLQEFHEIVQIEIYTEGIKLPLAQLQTVSELVHSKETAPKIREVHDGTLEMILAQGIVRTLGGEIKVHSSQGIGIRFLIVLPKNSNVENQI